ncbi:MAG: sensor histidine kinase [Propionibacteriaceae bacterium]
MQGLTRGDVALAVGFVLAAALEAVVLHGDTTGLLAFGAAGAPLLAVLAVRRVRPVVSLCVIAAFCALGTSAQTVLWPDAQDSGGVWLFALMFASFSIGAHGRGRAVALGGLLPLLVGLAIDLPTMTGWALVNGIIFLTTFTGVLPTAVGRVVMVRRGRLTALDDQRKLIGQEQRVQRQAAVLAQRLETAERLQPALLDGLSALADSADGGAEPGAIEQAARQLLVRTREEAVVLTASVDVPAEPAPCPTDHLSPLRVAAQPWVVIGAGAIGSGLALESTVVLPLATPAWVAVLASLAVCVPLAMVWWRPLVAVTVAWCAAVAFSRLVAPLDGSLSGAGMALAAGFAVAALSTRRIAVIGLLVCWLGQLVGVGTGDPFGEAVIILISWLGGLVVNEVSRLVEQSRVNNQLLAGQETMAVQRAVVAERLRMAREVHDQLGHSLTVVALQAGAARRMPSTDPRIEEVMATIAAAARDGLAAMRGEAAGGLAALLQRTRAAGVTINADVAELELLDPEQRLLACRVVQEALTNVLRHAPGAEVEVAVRGDAGGARIVVRNCAATRPGRVPGSGSGLRGLRDTVATRGGALRWGPRTGGGFEVYAVLHSQRVDGVER